jgi:nitrate reductase NapE component
MDAKTNKEENRKNTNHLTYGLWPFLKIFNLGHFGLCQWLK